MSIQRARTSNAAYLRRVRGLALSVPNDVFNGFSRTLHTADGKRTLAAIPEAFERVGNAGNWLNLDDKLGVVSVYGGNPEVARLPGRQIPLNIWNSEGPKPGGGYLYCEEIAQGVQEGLKYYGPRETIFDCAAVVMTADASATAAYAGADGAAQVDAGDPHLRAVKVKGGDGASWLILVNFSESPKTFTPEQVSGWLGGPGEPLHRDTGRLEPLGIGVWHKR